MNGVGPQLNRTLDERQAGTDDGARPREGRPKPRRDQRVLAENVHVASVHLDDGGKAERAADRGRRPPVRVTEASEHHVEVVPPRGDVRKQRGGVEHARQRAGEGGSVERPRVRHGQAVDDVPLGHVHGGGPTESLSSGEPWDDGHDLDVRHSVQLTKLMAVVRRPVRLLPVGENLGDDEYAHRHGSSRSKPHASRREVRDLAAATALFGSWAPQQGQGVTTHRRGELTPSRSGPALRRRAHAHPDRAERGRARLA